MKPELHLHIVGIGGTFMAGLARIARELGYRVTGSDTAIYPPMSTQLAELDIPVAQGYSPDNLEPAPHRVVIGNALSRGNPEVEAILERGLPYTSGAQWLAEHALRDRWVIALAGTHGKTTTASMVAWILERAGLNPGFLIGGVPRNFGVSARLGAAPFFVIEADEYDTAFFDKRSKFLHYRPRTLVLNNLEYDHADIFPDLDAIKLQFQYLLRTVPPNGRIIVNHQDANLASVLERGCWSEVEEFGGGAWQEDDPDGTARRARILVDGAEAGVLEWSVPGSHNLRNALAALAAARHAGVTPKQGIEALAEFESVKRRLEVRYQESVTVYDDFAHHPTEIRETLRAVRARSNGGRVVAVLEPRSNTMRLGIHRDNLAAALAEADRVDLFRPAGLDWDLAAAVAPLNDAVRISDSVDDIVDHLLGTVQAGDHIVIMSNGGFGGIHEKLMEGLRRQKG
ncbi:MAG: UDP-N-acetylmuramate:L-alanyl-gamma-D-glutamyl-meso-diaminopimelate ligase [Acidiferrobacteraceae bacterium]|jgi:UDP-N-acetylmuramate: L-alanyl-gamma-D-glutamyl-meso-diaminopimelate ligase